MVPQGLRRGGPQQVGVRRGGHRVFQRVGLGARLHHPEGLLRGHTYHHSLLDSRLVPLVRGRCPNGKPTAEAVFRDGQLTASYIHFYLPSNPQAAAALFAPTVAA